MFLQKRKRDETQTIGLEFGLYTSVSSRRIAGFTEIKIISGIRSETVGVVIITVRKMRRNVLSYIQLDKVRLFWLQKHV